jgi:hypothetical protein
MLASKRTLSAGSPDAGRARAPLAAAARRSRTSPLLSRRAAAATEAPAPSSQQQMPDLPGIASSVTQLVGNTPMVRLNRLSAAEGAKATVLAKVSAAGVVRRLAAALAPRDRAAHALNPSPSPPRPKNPLSSRSWSPAAP